MIAKIDLPIYNQDVYLVINTTSKENAEEINTVHNNNTEPIEKNNDSRGFYCTSTFILPHGGTKTRFYVCLEEKETVQGKTTLEHELIHLTWDLLDYLGIEIDNYNHEPFTYLYEYFLVAMRKEIEKLAINKI